MEKHLKLITSDLCLEEKIGPTKFFSGPTLEIDITGNGINSVDPQFISDETTKKIQNHMGKFFIMQQMPQKQACQCFEAAT